MQSLTIVTLWTPYRKSLPTPDLRDHSVPNMDFFHVVLLSLLFILSFFFNFYFIFGCVGSSLLHMGFIQLWRVGATLHCGVHASHCSGFFCCRARALSAWASVVVAQGLSSCGSQAQQCGTLAQQLWLTGLVAPRHVGSSRTGAQTCVPHIGRQILNHRATREEPLFFVPQTYLGSFSFCL